MNGLTQLYPLQIKPGSPTLLSKPRGIQHLLLNFKRPKLFPGPRALGLYPMMLTFIPGTLPHQEETSLQCHHLYISTLFAQVALEVKCHGGKPANTKGARGAGLISGSGRSPRVGNGNPLQYSCLENSMGTGVWWTTVHGVADSQTQLTTNAKKKKKHNAVPYAYKGFPLYPFFLDCEFITELKYLLFLMLSPFDFYAIIVFNKLF